MADEAHEEEPATALVCGILGLIGIAPFFWMAWLWGGKAGNMLTGIAVMVEIALPWVAIAAGTRGKAGFTLGVIGVVFQLVAVVLCLLRALYIALP